MKKIINARERKMQREEKEEKERERMGGRKREMLVASLTWEKVASNGNSKSFFQISLTVFFPLSLSLSLSLSLWSSSDVLTCRMTSWDPYCKAFFALTIEHLLRGKYHRAPPLFILFGFRCFDYVECNNIFTCLAKSKPVKQEASHAIILPFMVSVLCPNQRTFTIEERIIWGLVPSLTGFDLTNEKVCCY